MSGTRVKGKVCIVTGGAMGLGKADAIMLASQGAQLVITDIDVAQGEALATQIGSGAIFIQHDVRSETDWMRVLDAAMRAFGRLDVLVNNAGVVAFEDIESFTLDKWRWVFEVSVRGAVLGCRHCIPLMHASGGHCSIINMSSTAAISGMRSIPAYSAAKGALRSLTRHVAAYCRQKGFSIRCNALHPTSMDTPMVAAAVAAMRDFVPEGQSANGTQPGSPLNIANAVLYLASDESLGVNGSALVIDRATTIMEGMAP